MKRRVVVINFCMLMGIILMAMRFISAWESFEEANSLEQIASSAGREAMEGSSGVAPMGSPLPFSDFIVISERNLFAEDRRPPAVEGESEVETAVPVEAPPKWTGRPTLHGVSAMGGGWQAILTVFEGDGAAGQLRTVRVGDSVQGYKVAEIGDSIVRLTWKDREEIIDIADAQGSPPAGKSAAAAVTVITVGSAPAAVQATARKGAGQQEGTGIEVSVVGGQSNQTGRGQADRAQESEVPSPGQGAQRSPRRR